MSKHHDDSTYATNPGKLLISVPKFNELWGALPLLARIVARIRGHRRRFLNIVAEHMQFGDTCPALVASTKPLLVAAYSEDIDCVALLAFPSRFVHSYKLAPGKRLVTINTYGAGEQVASDLVAGPENTGDWVNFFPIIAEFMCNDAEGIQRAASTIDENLWDRCKQMAREYLRRPVVMVREGTPLEAHSAATRALAIRPSVVL